MCGLLNSSMSVKGWTDTALSILTSIWATNRLILLKNLKKNSLSEGVNYSVTWDWPCTFLFSTTVPTAAACLTTRIGFLSPWHGASTYGGICEHYWVLKSSSGQPTTGGLPAWGMSEGLTTPFHKEISLRNVTWGLEIGQILWNDLGNGKWI
jgi:hypothetical protein